MINEESWVASAFTLACLYSVLVAAFLYFFSSWISSIFSSLRQWRALWLAALLCTALPLLNGIIVPESIPDNADELFDEGFSVDPVEINSTVHSYVKLSNVAGLIEEWLFVGVGKVAPIWLYLFTIGLLVQFLLRARRWYQVWRVVNQAEKLSDAEALRINALFENVVDPSAADFLRREGIRILKTNRSHSPFVLSFPQPTLIVSDTALIELSDPQLALVLEHELVHLSNKDPLLTLLAGWVPILLWFNPYVHRLYQQFNLAVELNCDARVLEGRREIRHQYLGAILAILNARSGSNLKLNNAALGDSTATMLKTRLFCIQKPLPQSRHKIRRMLALVGGLLAFITLNSALQPSVVAQTSGGVDELILQLQTQLPSLGARVTSKFGLRADPINGSQVTHRGIDYAAAKGAPIVATGNGRVSFAGEKDNYGNRIDIDHGHSVFTLYANLGEIMVQEGQLVRQGETIALMGVSGRSTGPHVHYEVRHNGESICPSQHCLDRK